MNPPSPQPGLGPLRFPVFLMLLLLAAVAYGPAFTNAYTYDGREQMRFLGDKPLSALSFVFNPDKYRSDTGVLSYRPLYTGGFLVFDVHLFQRTPALSHGFNLLIHVSNCWLLFSAAFILLRRSGASHPRALAFVAAALPLVHPLASSVVLCPGWRTDLGGATGPLLAVWLTARFLETGRHAPREIGLLSLAIAGVTLLGLGHKEIGVLAVPLAVLVLLLFGGRAMWRPALAVGAGGALAAFLFFLVWRNFKSAHFSGAYLCATGPIGGFINFLVSLAEVHLRRFLWPWPLRVYYLPDCINGPGDPRLALALAQLGAVAGIAGLVAWRNRVAALGVLWIILAYLPVSQLVPIPEPVAERFSYQPVFAAGLVLAGGATLILGRWPQCGRLAAIAGLMLLFAWVGVTHRRAWDWQDDHTLLLANWTETAETRPERYIIPASLHINRAAALADAGDRDGRETELARARLEIRALRHRYPGNPHGYRLEAVYQIHRGNRAAAAENAREALRLNPQDAEIRAVARLAGIQLAP